MNSNSFVVNFDLTADEVNALDTTPVSLGTFGASDSTALVRVPVRAEIWRDAGTAYVVDNVVGRSRVLEFNHISFPPPPMTLSGDATTVGRIEPSKALFVRCEDDAGGRGPVLFSIPAGILENTTKCGMVVMPEPGQSHLGGPITLTIEAGTGIASGTGSLHGRLYFDEFPLPI